VEQTTWPSAGHHIPSEAVACCRACWEPRSRCSRAMHSRNPSAT